MNGNRYGKPDHFGRVPMTPHEFAIARHVLRLELIDLRFAARISGRQRTQERNEKVGGSPKSKHLLDPMMAVDFVVHDHRGMIVQPDSSYSAQVIGVAVDLGLWARYHDAGSGPHLHLQGLPRGMISPLWLADWATDSTTEWACRVYAE